MKQMADIFVTLNSDDMNSVTETLTNAGIIKSTSGNYMHFLKIKKKENSGKLRKIYLQLMQLEECEFDNMIEVMTK